MTASGQEVRNIAVYARVSPEHKLRIVRCLAELGGTWWP